MSRKSQKSMSVFKKDNEKMSEENISSKYWEDEGKFFLSFFPPTVFSTVASGERVGHISLVSKELTGNWLSSKKEFSLPGLRASCPITPSSPCPLAKPPCYNPWNCHLTEKQKQCKPFSKRTIDSTKHKTNTQQESNPMWLLAGAVTHVIRW